MDVPYRNELLLSAHGLISRKAQTWARRARDYPADREDFEQEMIARVLPHLAGYDPTRANLEAYVTLLVTRAAADWYRAHAARKRGFGVRHLSLNAGAGLDPVETRSALKRENDRDREIEVAAVLKDLPPDQRDLAEALLRLTPTEIARRRGSSRSQVRSSIAQLRSRFEQAGLQIYC